MKGRVPPVLVLLLALGAPLLSLVHTWRGYERATPPSRVFLGFPFMPTDHYQYAAFIRQAAEGRFFMENLFTSETQGGVFVMLYYWILGTVSRLAGLSTIATWLVFQVVVGFIYILMFWVFTRHYVEPRGRRIGAVLIFCFAGGLDWVFVLVSRVSQGAAALTEPYGTYWNWATFGSLSVPNWIWGAFLMTLALHLALRGRAWAGALIMPVLWLSHHHTGMVAYLTFGLLPLAPAVTALCRLESIPWDKVRSRLGLALPSLLSFAAVAAYLLWAGKDPVFAANAAASSQWKVFFTPWWYPITYGLLLPFAWFGIRSMARERSAAGDVCLSWLVAAVFLSINPIAGGAKYQFLVFPPLVLLAARGLSVVRDSSPAAARRMRDPLIAGLVVVGLFSNAPVSLVLRKIAAFDEANAYSSAADLAAMRWLEGQPQGVVLSFPSTGALVPWRTGHKAYIGHWFMTINYATKQREMQGFFAPSVPTAAKADFLQRSGMDYVYHGPAEAQAGGVIDPALPLERVYHEQGVSIYRVGAAPR